MKIKELENLLSIPRSNIRFYEKQGLFCPERQDNNYRDYTEQDIKELKKIIVFRKMGLTVEEIKLIQNNKLPFSQAITNAKQRLETEIKQLNGSLNLVKQISKENSSFDDIDINKHWDNIEKSNDKFIDICKDYLKLELSSFDFMMKFAFFYDFKKSRAKHGVLKALVILFLLCVLRGIGKVIIWQESFWSGFFYPFIIFLLGSIIILPLFLLSKKSPKIASKIANILLCLMALFLVGILLFIIFAII